MQFLSRIALTREATDCSTLSPAACPNRSLTSLKRSRSKQRTAHFCPESFAAAIGEAKDKGASALEAFAFRYPEGQTIQRRFLLHRTVFPHDFLSDFGFLAVRTAGRVELARLELGGLQTVAEGKRAQVLRLVQEAFAPAPVPQRP